MAKKNTKLAAKKIFFSKGGKFFQKMFYCIFGISEVWNVQKCNKKFSKKNFFFGAQRSQHMHAHDLTSVILTHILQKFYFFFLETKNKPAQSIGLAELQGKTVVHFQF